MAHTTTSIEELHRAIAELAVERQDLRARGADRSTLERNRRELVARQLELCHALIARYGGVNGAQAAA